MTKYQIADTPTMMLLASDAIAAGYNRQLDLNNLAKNIDPGGIHLCYFSMLHEHIAGVKVDPHMRTLWKLKIKNQSASQPEEVSLDISMENFRNLAIHDTEDPDHEKQVKRNKVKARIIKPRMRARK